MNEKIERMMREVKNCKRTQSIPRRNNNEQTTSRIGTPNHMNNGDGGINASDTENQENRKQDNPFGPSKINELRTPIPPSSVQNRELEDYHMVTGAVKPPHRQDSNNKNQ